MSLQELLANPIVLGIIATIITYAYLYWDNLEKQKKKPKVNIEPVSMMTPVIVGLLVFVIAYNLLGKSVQNVPSQIVENSAFISQQQDVNAKMQCNKFIENTKPKSLDMLDSATYHLVGKNAIRLPQTDVFIDLAKF